MMTGEGGGDKLTKYTSNHYELEQERSNSLVFTKNYKKILFRRKIFSQNCSHATQIRSSRHLYV